MAKVSAEAKETASLLQGLRNAIDGQGHPLRGTQATGGLFPAARTADLAARKALDSGYLKPTDPPPGVKPKKDQVFVRLTDKGQQFLVAHDPAQKILAALLPVVHKLVGQLPGLIDALTQTLPLLQGALRPAASATTKPAPQPAAEFVVFPPATDLPSVLHHAYERLRGLTEFRDGLVALPRLYHEALKTVPGLTVDEYHRTLNQLWHGGQVELHVLNEVRTAREPEKAITRNDRLYYFLLWKNSS